MWSIADRDKGGLILLLREGTSPKVNVIARLEFELTNYDITAQHVNHYATGTSTLLFMHYKLRENVFQDLGVHNIFF